MTSAYAVTITRTDGTVSSYRASQDAAYQRVKDEISHSTPGISAVDIRPVAIETGTRVAISSGRHKGRNATVEGKDLLGRLILRVDGYFAPVFTEPGNVTIRGGK